MKKIIKCGVVVLTLILIAILGIRQLTPPNAAPADTAVTEFSSSRAMEHIKTISQVSHPMGTEENYKVRDYIVDTLKRMDLKPEVQGETVANPDMFEGVEYNFLGRAQNVIAKISGSDPSKAIVLAGHYDTVQTSKGAADDASGVATLLESARVLSKNKQLKNDIIFLFTDGEELNYLGAKAFLKNKDYSKNIGFFLNFDSQGGNGPVICVGKIEEKSYIIKTLSKSVHKPMAYSFVSEFYDIVPDNSDFSMFKKAGFSGLNFGSLGDTFTYHTNLDNADHISLNTLQQGGEYAVELAKAFGNSSPANFIRGTRMTYFNVLGNFLINYPNFVDCIVLLAEIILFGLLLVLGFRRRCYSLKGILAGAGTFFISMIAAAVLSSIIWLIVLAIHGSYKLMPTGLTYNTYIYLTAFIAMSFTIIYIVSGIFIKKFLVKNIYTGIISSCLLLAVLCILIAPGAVYLFVWPLLFGILTALWIMLKPETEDSNWRTILVLCIDAIPPILLFIPLIYCILAGFGLNFPKSGTPSIGATVIVIALLILLLTPQIEAIRRMAGKWMNIVSIIISLIFIVIGSLTSGFDTEHPKPNGVWYMQDVNSKASSLNSFGTKPDEWSKQFFQKDYKTAILSSQIDKPSIHESPNKAGEAVITRSVPSAKLPAPTLNILGDKKSSGIREIKMHISSPRKANILGMQLVGAEVIGAVADGVNIEKSSQSSNLIWTMFDVTMPEQGIDITLQMNDTSRQARMNLWDVSYELPEIPGMNFVARPDSMMSAKAELIGIDQSSVVIKSYELK